MDQPACRRKETHGSGEAPPSPFACRMARRTVVLCTLTWLNLIWLLSSPQSSEWACSCTAHLTDISNLPGFYDYPFIASGELHGLLRGLSTEFGLERDRGRAELSLLSTQK